MLKKTKAMVQKRRLRRRETLTVKDHGIEVVRRFKYQGTVINDTNDENEEIRARIPAARKAYSSPQTIFRSKQMHRNNKVKTINLLNTKRRLLCLKTRFVPRNKRLSSQL